jgi:hypothetical protein
MSRLTSLIVVFIFLSGCTRSLTAYSYRNLGDEVNQRLQVAMGYGGYRIFELKTGVYNIHAETNQVYKRDNIEVAREMWRDQAVSVCGDDNFLEKNIDEREIYHPRPKKCLRCFPDQWTNVKNGIVVCLGSFFEPLIVNQGTSAAEFRELVSGNTFSGVDKKGSKFDIYHAPNGTMLGRTTSKWNKEYEDSGFWQITHSCQYCQTWKKWLDHKKTCFKTKELQGNKYRKRPLGRSLYESQLHETTFVIREGDTEELARDLWQAPLNQTPAFELTGTCQSEIAGKSAVPLKQTQGGSELTGTWVSDIPPPEFDLSGIYTSKVRLMGSAGY